MRKFTNTPSNDMLCQSLLMLELYGDGKYDDAELVAAAHSMVQRALFMLCGTPSEQLPPITHRGQEITAKEIADLALYDVKNRGRE